MGYDQPQVISKYLEIACGSSESELRDRDDSESWWGTIGLRGGVGRSPFGARPVRGLARCFFVQ